MQDCKLLSSAHNIEPDFALFALDNLCCEGVLLFENRQIVFVNKKFERLGGMIREDLFRTSSLGFLQEKDRSRFWFLLSSCTESLQLAQTGHEPYLQLCCDIITSTSDVNKHREEVVVQVGPGAQTPTNDQTFSEDANVATPDRPPDEVVKLMVDAFYKCNLHMATAELCDNDTDIILRNVNPTMEKRWRMSAKQLYGKRMIRDLKYTPKDTACIIERWLKAKQEKRVTHYEYHNTQTRVVYNNFLLHVSENIFGFISMDMSREKELENNFRRYSLELEEQVKARTNQLEEALQIKSRFLAIMSHEIRTPLSGIMGTISVLSLSALTQEQSEMIRIQQACGDHLLLLVDDILDLSKLEENRVQLEHQPFSLKSVLEESMEVVAFEGYKKKLEMICDFNPYLNESDMVLGDARRLRQIVINLLSNAVKFSVQGEIGLSLQSRLITTPPTDTSPFPTQTRFTPFNNSNSKVSINTPYCEVIVSVRDEGIGITQEAQATLFQPFTQADTSMTRKYGGSGLGLSICRRLTELMGGRMWLQSEEGKGSTFRFSMLLAPAFPHSCYSCPPVWQAWHGQNQHILIVEKNETLRRVLSELLRSWDFVPICVGDVYSALQILAGQSHSENSNGTNQITSDEQLHSEGSVESSFGTIQQQQIVWYAALVDGGLYQDSLQLIAQLHQRIQQTIIMTNDATFVPSHDMRVIKKPIREKSLNTLLYEIQHTLQHPTELPERGTTNKKQKLERSGCTWSILVVEDNILSQKVIKKLLEKLGFMMVDIVGNGLDAINAIGKSSYDVILMDCMMPEMGGIEATEKIRALHPQNPYIIALTADVLEDNKKKCLESGMNAVLTKPIQVHLLKQALEAGLHAACRNTASRNHVP